MISSLATKPLVDRLVLRLLELVDSGPERRRLRSTPRISQSTLAAMVGVSRENVNRALAGLVASGAIRQERRSVRAGRRGPAAREWWTRSGPVAAGSDRRFDPASRGCRSTVDRESDAAT